MATASNKKVNSDEDYEESEGEEEPPSKVAVASTTRMLHSLTEVVDKIKRNAFSRSKQSAVMSKAVLLLL